MVSNMRKAQVSVEYILLLAFTFAVLIPGIFLFHSYSQRNTATVNGAQYTKLGQQMVAMAVQSAAQGEGSWLTLDTNIPDSIEDINITTTNNGTELIITYQTNFGDTQAVFFSDIILAADMLAPSTGGRNGSIFANQAHAGRSSFRFTSGNGAVGIKEMNN